MKYLQMLNLTLTAVAATFALVLGVVAILYGFHLDESTAVARQFPALLQLVVVFTVCTLVSAVTWWSRHRLKSWATVMQFGSAFTWAVSGFAIAILLGITQ